MKTIARILLLVLCLASTATAANRISATVTITDTAVDADTFIVNGVTRTWKDTVTVPATQIAMGGTINTSRTNLYNHLLGTPPANVVVFPTGAATFRLDATTGSPLVIGGAGSYFTVSYSTQVVASADTVVVPYTTIASGIRQKYTDGLVNWLNLTAGVTLDEDSPAMAELVGLANAQTIDGEKTFSALIANDAVLNAPATTDLVNTGNAISSQGPGLDSEQFGADSVATADASLAIGKNAGVASGANGGIAIGNLAYVSTDSSAGVAIGGEAEANGINATAVGTGSRANFDNSAAYGYGAIADEENATAIGTTATASHLNSTAIGYGATSTRANQTVLGSGTVELLVRGGLTVVGASTNNAYQGTNDFLLGGDIAFKRYAVTSLANGNNAAVPVGTNIFVEVSGPSGAFTINGINAATAQRDGKLLIIVNQTGQNMTIAHESGTDPAAGNRIITMTAGDRATTGNGAAMLIYSAAASRWILIALDP